MPDHRCIFVGRGEKKHAALGRRKMITYNYHCKNNIIDRLFLFGTSGSFNVWQNAIFPDGLQKKRTLLQEDSRRVVFRSFLWRPCALQNKYGGIYVAGFFQKKRVWPDVAVTILFAFTGYYSMPYLRIFLAMVEKSMPKWLAIARYVPYFARASVSIFLSRISVASGSVISLVSSKGR